jgi:hypothetical protein
MNNGFVRFPVMFATILLALPLWMVSRPSDKPAAKTFTGEVTDSFCAKNGSPSSRIAIWRAPSEDQWVVHVNLNKFYRGTLAVHSMRVLLGIYRT